MYRYCGDDYTNMPFYQAQRVMDNWVQNLHDLIYVPWPFDEYDTIHVQSGPKEFSSENGNRLIVTTSDLTAWANEPNWNRGLATREESRRNDLNFIRGIRNLYLRYGWPGQFQKQEFFAALQQLNDRKEEHDDKVHNANPMAGDSTEPHPDEVEPRKQRMEFLEEAAGQLAIKRT